MTTVFAISDLHLPAHQKPMDIFGPHWENHFERIRASWLEQVQPDDIVLLPGDTSWAMTLSDAKDDIARIGELPGRKILIRGNHDFWWSSISRVRDALPQGMTALQNDAVLMDDYLFAGSRGWVIPGAEKGDPDDIKVFEREKIRLRLSLSQARRLSGTSPLIVLMHYPPLTQDLPGFSDILHEYRVDACVYGHLHGNAIHSSIDRVVDGIRYFQVSCDGLDFHVRRILP